MTNGNDRASGFRYQYDSGDEVELGLTKREHFAALAMQGLLSRPNWPLHRIAVDAVEQADALIAALNAKEEEQEREPAAGMFSLSDVTGNAHDMGISLTEDQVMAIWEEVAPYLKHNTDVADGNNHIALAIERIAEEADEA
jgi:hypothetical protein